MLDVKLEVYHAISFFHRYQIIPFWYYDAALLSCHALCGSDLMRPDPTWSDLILTGKPPTVAPLPRATMTLISVQESWCANHTSTFACLMCKSCACLCSSGTVLFPLYFVGVFLPGRRVVVAMRSARHPIAVLFWTELNWINGIVYYCNVLH